jgi:hypothetical protein
MAYVAIKTQWFAPTNYRGGRIKATAMDCFTDRTFPSITKAEDGYGEQSQEEMHHAVAMELLPQVCNSPNDVELVAGATRTGYVFVIQQKVGV